MFGGSEAVVECPIGVDGKQCNAMYLLSNI